MSRVIVTIERLTLVGLNPAQQQGLVDALRNELARTLADPTSGLAAVQSRHTPTLRIGPLTIEPGAAGARKLGGGIARALGKRVGS